MERFNRNSAGGFVAHCYSTGSLPGLRAALFAQGFAIYELPGELIRDKRSLFELISHTLPWDGPPPGPGLSWDALVDSLCGGIEEKSLPAVAILWCSAELVLRGTLQLVLDAAQALWGAADDLQHLTAKLGHPIILRLFFIGEGPSFRDFRDAPEP
jgi:hypothetical protein